MVRPSSRSSRISATMAPSVLHVDAGERLVEQDDARLLRQRARQEHALLLSAAQLADLALAVVGDADPLQRLVHLALVLAAGDAQEAHVAVAAHHHHVLDQDREVPVDLLALRHVGDDAALQRLVARAARRCAPRRARLARSP